MRIEVTDTGHRHHRGPAGATVRAVRAAGRASRLRIEGTGIGLALYAIVWSKPWAAPLGVESALPGEGSVFWVELRAVVDGPVGTLRTTRHRDAANSRSATTRQAIERHTILAVHRGQPGQRLKLVQRVRSLIATTCRRSSRPCREASDLELAREHQPDAHPAGPESPRHAGRPGPARACGHNPLTAPIPVVMSSADATAGQRQRLLTAGCERIPHQALRSTRAPAADRGRAGARPRPRIRPPAAGSPPVDS